MNEEDKIHINSLKFYDRDELEELTKEYYLENKQLKEKLDCDLKWAFKCDELTKENQKLKEQLQQKEEIINKAKEHLKLKVIRYSNETDYTLDETDLKEIIQILDNKGRMEK